MLNVSQEFWKGKQVLLTGHTGFKGAWLSFWLHQLGAEVTGVSLPPISTPNLFTLAGIEDITNSHFIDICNADAVSRIVNKVCPEIVLHLAAQALVRGGYKDPMATFSTNVMGTTNILNSLRDISSVKAVVVVTTDKVYKNLEHIHPYQETDPLGGRDPYSASKVASEIIVTSYRDSFLAERGVAVATARAGNVIGGGDWSEDRLIPDAVRAWGSAIPLKIRRPNAVRPWQHVLEPLNGYLILAEKLYDDLTLAGPYNFGPESCGITIVRNVIELANKSYGCGIIQWGDGAEGPHEAGLLALDISKSKEVLGITPRWDLIESIERTIRWYKLQRSGISANTLCKTDIENFMASRKVSRT